MSIRKEAISRYPYVVGEYGIDFAGFDETEYSDTLKDVTGSGRAIYYRFNERGISVYDPNMFPLNIRGYELASNMVNDETINFSLYTIWSGLWHHPDMFAAIFVELAVAHFEENGYEVRSWLTQWYPYSVNYKQYIKGLQIGLSSVEAAALTWSGIQSMKLGFRPETELPPSYRDEGARVFRFVRK